MIDADEFASMIKSKKEERMSEKKQRDEEQRAYRKLAADSMNQLRDWHIRTITASKQKLEGEYEIHTHFDSVNNNYVLKYFAVGQTSLEWVNTPLFTVKFDGNYVIVHEAGSPRQNKEPEFCPDIKIVTSKICAYLCEVTCADIYANRLNQKDKISTK